MYEIQIESEEFKEKRTVQQHQMVNQVSRGKNVPLPPLSERACGVAMALHLQSWERIMQCCSHADRT